MGVLVDLTNLRSMTDGDVEMEKELFREFFISFESGITSLKANTGESAAEAWRKDAHALKGIALNLGASKLGELCKQGQDDYMSNDTVKNAMIAAISTEYKEVHEFLKKLIAM